MAKNSKNKENIGTSRKRSANRENVQKSNNKKRSSGLSVKKEAKKETKIQKSEPRAKRKKKGALKFLLLIILLAILISGIYLLLNHSTFNIVSFNLSGTDRYSVYEIAEKLGIEKGKNIFLEILTCSKEKVKEFPYIEKLDFEIKLPNEINFKVSERISSYFAYDKEKNKYFKLDKNGYILEESTLENKTKDEILMHAITFDDEVILGEKINEIDMSKIQVFLQIKSEFEKSQISKTITKVNFENSLTTLTLNDKLNVIFPNKDELVYKIAFLKEILKSIGEDAGGVVDLTKEKPTYSSF